MNKQKGPLEEPAGEWFVNRRQELTLFWQWATGIPHPGRQSYALIGLRRTGKTAILHKTFNRLFHEQERVLPVYISFVQYLNRAEPITAYEFASEFFTGYIRSYLAFRYQQPELFQSPANYNQLYQFAQKKGDALAVEWFEIYEGERAVQYETAHNLMQWVINFPKGIAWKNELPAALFIDEFQVLTRVYNPDTEMMRDLTDSFQHASETRYAPMLVSGSSVSMMVGRALGGLLSGRFQTWHLDPLTEEFAIALVFRLGQSLGIRVTHELAIAIYEETQGYPFPIERIMHSLSPDLSRLPDVDALNDIIVFELTHDNGALRTHYEDEYGKYIHEINGDNVTRKILFWVANFPKERIYPDQVAEIFGLNLTHVSETLDRLYNANIISRAGISTFWGPRDPLMREFLKYTHYIEIDKLTEQDAETKLRATLNSKQGEMNRQVGHFTEIIVAGLLTNFDGRKIEGHEYFNTKNLVTLHPFDAIVRREGVIKEGKIHEIDVIGEYIITEPPDGNSTKGAWLVSVRYRDKKMGISDVEAFITHANAIQKEKQYREVTKWYFSKSGFTKEAQTKLRAAGIYHSTLAQFNTLANLFSLPALEI